MDEFTRLYVQRSFDRDYPPPPPPEETGDETMGKAFKAGAEPKKAEPKKEPTAGEFATVGMDTLAGMIKGAVAATIGLPGDLESLVRLLIGGQQRMVTTEDMQKALPPVVPDGDPARQEAAKRAEFAGEFLPVAPVAGARAAARGLRRMIKYDANGRRTEEVAAESAGNSRVLKYDTNDKRIQEATP